MPSSWVAFRIVIDTMAFFYILVFHPTSPQALVLILYIQVKHYISRFNNYFCLFPKQEVSLNNYKNSAALKLYFLKI